MSTKECKNPNCDETFDPSEEGFKCPECNAPLQPDEVEGTEDGGSEDEDDDEQPNTVPISSEDTECPECGESVKEEAKFCPSCGEELGSEDGEEVEKPEIACPDPDCDNNIPKGADFCPICGTNRSADSADSADEDEEGLSVVFEVEGEEHEVVEDGAVVLENDGDRPDNSYGIQARKAVANARNDSEEARKIHRGHVLVEVEGDEVIIEDDGRNPTTHNGDSLSQGDRVELSDGDSIGLSGVTTIDVRMN